MSALTNLRARIEAEAARKVAAARLEAERVRAEAEAERLAAEHESQLDASPASHRTALAAAIAERGPAVAAAEKARAALARAAKLVETDEAIARERAELAQAQAKELTRQIEAADLRETPELLAMAKEVDRHQASLDAAREKLSKIKTAQAVLADGSTQADRALAEVEHRIFEAAAVVASDEANFLVDVLVGINDQVYDITNRVDGFIELYHNSGMARKLEGSSLDRLNQVLRRTVRSLDACKCEHVWTQYFNALQSDAAATYGEAEHPTH